ncbi:MAG: nitroreductase family protein [Terriglobales bacterium]
MSALREVPPLAERPPEKLLSEVVRERRATPHFAPTPIPDHDLREIIQAGLEAPSGYNLQPWRFLVVRDPQQKKRLREAAMGQAKVEEAPVVIVACGDTEGWKKGDLDDMLRLGNERGFPESGNDSARQAVGNLLSGKGGEAAGISQNNQVWVNRHVMIAFTTIMWMAEALGYDTAPMEGFWEDKVKQVLNIPPEVRVIALLAIGHRAGDDKKYGGRFDWSHTVFADEWGKPLKV